MSHSLRKCTKCSWTGYEPKWALCPVCGNTYYRCPYCGSRTEPIKPVYTKVITTPNASLKRNRKNEHLAGYFLNKFKEMGIEPVSLESQRRKSEKKTQSLT